MDLAEILKSVMAITRTTQGEIATATGVTKQSLSRSLKTGSLKWDTFSKAMDYLGYEMIVRPKSGTMELKIGSLGEDE